MTSADRKTRERSHLCWLAVRRVAARPAGRRQVVLWAPAVRRGWVCPP